MGDTMEILWQYRGNMGCHENISTSVLFDLFARKTWVVQRIMFPIEAALEGDISQCQPKPYETHIHFYSRQEVIFQCQMGWVFPRIRILRRCRLQQVIVRGENYEKLVNKVLMLPRFAELN